MKTNNDMGVVVAFA